MRFTNYQNLGDGIKHKLADKQEGSVFWEKGKWDNYVLPLLPKNPKGLTYIDMGTNGGLFLHYAKDLGFKRAVGVDINPDVVERGVKYRDRVGGDWEIFAARMEEAIDNLPMCDYMTFINSHYYLLIKEWLELVDKLRRKTRYVIITTVNKYRWYCMASGRSRDVKKYFKDWEMAGYVPQLPVEGDSCPRSLSTINFMNKDLERVKIGDLKRGAHVKTDFHEEVDKGVDPFKTKYFRRLRANHKKSPIEELRLKMLGKVEMFNDVKKNGVKEPIIINKHNRILDGNHRARILDYLGYESAIVRRV